MIVRPAIPVVLSLLLTLLSSRPAGAQQLGPSTGGLVAVDQARRFLGHNKRVLMIGAHPDDEDTELLTILARGLGVEAAYLSLTRGEGGQNLIGSELGAGLGVLRTEELLGARSLDGARQYFTRTYDFGYSKGLPDTWRTWPKDSVLKDVVRIIRRFQPQVIVSVFSGTPRDGHGQHQAAGWAAREAFQAAGDPTRFPELLTEEALAPWTPLKLYRSARFDTAGATLTLEGGVLDQAVGQSFLQIAMRGRSLHRSQDMGVLQRMGPSLVRLALEADRTGAGGGALFAGVDTSVAGILPDSPAASDQQRRDEDVRFATSGVLCDAVSDDEQVAPGQRVMFSLSCWNASRDTTSVTGALTVAGQSSEVFRARLLEPGGMLTANVTRTVPADAPLTQPYFLAEPTRPGALYAWPTGPNAAVGGEPFGPAFARAEFRLASGGALRREVVYRYADQALGEIRHPVVVVPRVGVALDPRSGLWAEADALERVFTVTLRHGARDTTAGKVVLEVPAGWTVSASQPFRLTRESEEAVVRFTVRPAAVPKPGRYLVQAVAQDASGARYAVGVVPIEYPHIHPRQLVRPASAEIVIARLALPPVRRIGYIRGAADRVPEALHGLGLDVVILSADTLARGDLTRYRAIVVGPRAYETEPALLEFNDRLLEFARRGGTVVVQYQQQTYFRGGFAPYPLSLTERPGEAPLRVSAPRVAEEDAPVTVLQPGHPALGVPNRIGPEDWTGWVQERGLYFARSWDAAWTPLLEMADSGEPPLRGGLLVAATGKGVYVYSGLSFFRELPAAVPGAARLLVNLIALRGDARGR